MTVESDEYLGESVLPEEIDDIAIPAPLDKILPWHSPRKQFVRELQWRRLTKFFLDKHLEKLNISNGCINYLTLPGVDYFDVEVISDLVKEKGVKLEVTGFLDKAVGNSVLARSEFRAVSLIENEVMTDTSITFHKKFEDISTGSSQAYREIEKRSPFHIVNIDACGSIAKPSAVKPTRIVDALHRLIELQLNRMREPWILFLTVDACPSSLSSEVREKLEEAIIQNASESTEFRDGAIALFEGENDDVQCALASIGDRPEQFISMFSLGLSKWMLHNVQAEKWNLSCKQFYSYSTNKEGDPSMSCLAFEFSPMPVQLKDQYGMVGPSKKVSSQGSDPSMSALRSAREMQNLDEKLKKTKRLTTNLPSNSVNH